MRGRAAVALALALLPGCPDTSCPPGSVDLMGRCVRADEDAAVGEDAFSATDAPADDAARVDALSPLDACVPGAYFVDGDGDDHGDPAQPVTACPREGLAALGDDCADDDETRYAGAAERCDGIDQDCDGASDEGLQRLVGAPVLVDGDASARPLHAAAVGESYLVAYHTSAGPAAFVARRVATDGTLLSAAAAVAGPASDALVRVVPLDAITASVVAAPGTSNPRAISATEVRVNTDPLTLLRSGPIGSTDSPFGTALARVGADLAIVHWDGGLAAGSFDPTLARTRGPSRLDGARDDARGLHLVGGELVLFETRGGQLEAMRLAPATLESLGRVVISPMGGVASLGYVAPDGAASFVDGDPTMFRVLRFDAGEIASGAVTVRPEPFTIGGAVGATPPAMAGSAAGADLVIGTRDGSAATLAWRHFDAAGGVTMGAPPSADDIPYATVARLSSREGAIFYVASTAGEPQLLMQRLGCE